MTRFVTERRVFYFEEPLFDVDVAELAIGREQGVFVCVPHLPSGLSRAAVNNELRRLLHELIETRKIDRPTVWYYTPMALEFSRDVRRQVTVFDCMDELSAFAGAPPELLDLEHEMFARADLVFTGGHSLYEAKRHRHRRVHAFPSSVDVAHFSTARTPQPDPVDQAAIPHPRLGFFGVIDERIDLALIDGVAAARPDWHLVLIGPTAKIDRSELPMRANVHYLGMKKYDELPAYLSGWDVALLPFARNASTRFISPTKTPEYLAAGCPVVSTSIRDVVRPYGEQRLVSIADTSVSFVEAVDAILTSLPHDWRTRVDTFLDAMSWDRTWAEMSDLVKRLERSTSIGTSCRPDLTRRPKRAPARAQRSFI